jgi:hypothetical protein
MTASATTWALVVGIDEYDEVKPKLTGAARDAVDTVTWLRRIGVPDAQILLHAAACDASRPAVDALGLSVGNCRLPALFDSFRALKRAQGDRLFVFLFGHGLFEPGGDQVFLTREADDDVLANLGIDWWARWLRGQRFTTQYLVMDGCLNLPYSENERARFVGGSWPAVNLPPPRSDVLQVFCAAASQGQRALEVEGHGLFVSTLLRALDPDRPTPMCVSIDESSGSLYLDLDRAMRNVVMPTVTERAAAQGRGQWPRLQILSAGATPSTLPVVELATAGTARIRVTVEPAPARQEIERLRMWSDDNDWRRDLPAAPATTVPVTYQSTLPRGVAVTARCTMHKDSSWLAPPQQDFVTADEHNVVFALRQRPSEQPPPPTHLETTINTVSRGAVVAAMDAGAYGNLTRILGETDLGQYIAFEPHETGPVLRARPSHARELREVTRQVSIALDSYLPDGVSTRAQSSPPSRQEGVLIRLTAAAARRLGGLLAEAEVMPADEQAAAPHRDDLPDEAKVVTVGEKRLSLRQLVHEPLVAVDPGPLTIRVSLPWGEWVQRVDIAPGEITQVQLPKRVGLPPLRVELLGANPYGMSGPKRSLVVAGSRFTPELLTSGGVFVARMSRRANGTPSLWRLAIRVAPPSDDAPPYWRALGAVRTPAGRVVMPLSEHGPVGVDLGDVKRAEPLATNPSADWDRLVASGRLDAVDHAAAKRLTKVKWTDPLLGLAGAYACYAQGADEYLSIVLDNLRLLDNHLPDVPLLNAALHERAHTRRPPALARELAALAQEHAVPLFRWGVSIGLQGAEYFAATNRGVEPLVDQLTELADHVIGTSIWTMWTEPE